MSKYYEKTEHSHTVRDARTPSGMWPQNMLDRMVEGFEKGWTSYEIQRDLYHLFPKFPKSRNAVMGKLFRMGLVKGRAGFVQAHEAQATWTQAMDDELHALNEKALPMKIMADAINKKHFSNVNYRHVSHRLAVLGLVPKALRNQKLAKEAKAEKGVAVRSRRKHPYSPYAQFSALPMEFPPDPPMPSTSVKCVEVQRGSCMWPVNSDVRDLSVCGEPVECGAYCFAHAAVAYRQPPTARRNRVFHRRNEFDTTELDVL